MEKAAGKPAAFLCFDESPSSSYIGRRSVSRGYSLNVVDNFFLLSLSVANILPDLPERHVDDTFSSKFGPAK